MSAREDVAEYLRPRLTPAQRAEMADIDRPRPFAVTRILSALALLIERDPALSRAAEVLADALELAAGTKRKGYVRVAICEDCMELADPHRGRIAHAANCPSKPRPCKACLVEPDEDGDIDHHKSCGNKGR